jgi:hypothetical protein
MTKVRVAWSAFMLIVSSLAVVIFLLSPWWSLAGLSQAAQAGDKYRLALYVDFPRLRMSVREQLNAQVLSTMSTEMKENPFATLGAMLGGAMIDRTIDLMVTPSTLARLMQTHARDAAEPRVPLAFRLYDRIGLEWLSASSIRVKIFDAAGRKTTTGLLERELLTWRLVDIEIPAR